MLRRTRTRKKENELWEVEVAPFLTLVKHKTSPPPLKCRKIGYIFNTAFVQKNVPIREFMHSFPCQEANFESGGFFFVKHLNVLFMEFGCYHLKGNVSEVIENYWFFFLRVT